MKEGDIILTQIPQSDGTLKIRPALVLRELPPFRDLLVCGISTQTHQAVRLRFLAVLPRSKVAGTIGRLSPSRYERLLRRLSAYLTEKIVKTSSK